MGPAGRFTDRASDYAQYRPTYPSQAIDVILSGLAEPTRLVAADVGAGTGISSRLLADRGVRVIAVEPNAAMRAAAPPHQRIQWRDGTAEATGLATESLDLVVCAQSFHWFEPRQALAEFHRILRPAGALALMWNNRDRRDELTRGFIEAIHAVNGEHPAERRPFDPGMISRDGRFTPPSLQTFEHWQELDGPGLIGRAISASYVPKEGPAFTRLTELLLTLFKRHREWVGGKEGSGVVKLRYVTHVYRAERR
jgi:SAM-dependent methyltransferase